MTSEYRHTARRIVDFSFGPLRFRSASEHKTRDRDQDGALALDAFADELRVLVALALAGGCSRQDINHLLGQYMNGDHHGDA